MRRKQERILLKQPEIETIISQIGIQLEELKDLKIYHRDIKPRNIIITENRHLKLTNFDFAVFSEQVSENSSFFTVGNLKYNSVKIQNYLKHGETFVDYDPWEEEKYVLKQLSSILIGNYQEQQKNILDKYVPISLGMDLVDDQKQTMEMRIKGVSLTDEAKSIFNNIKSQD